MASEILRLFTTPEQYQQNQLAQARSRAFQEVQLDPFQQAALGARTAGYQFGQAVGGALGGQDPQLQLIARRQQLLSQLDQSDPTSFARVAKIASDAGDQELAFGIAQAGREAAVKIAQASKERQLAVPADIQKLQMIPQLESAITKLKAVEQTPEIAQQISSLQRMLSVIDPAPKPEKVADKLQIGRRVAELETQLSPDAGVVLPPQVRAGLEAELNNLKEQQKENIIDVGVAEKTREVVYFDKNTKQQFIMKPNPTNPNELIPVPYSGGIDKTTALTKVSASSSSKGADEGAKTIAELSAKRVDAAQVSAAKAIEQAGLLQELLKTPQSISGSGASVRVGTLRVFSTFGLTSSKDDEALGNADKFTALAGERVISFIKALGSNPTDTDREFARTIGPALEKGTKTNADLINFLLERARKVVTDADAMEKHFYDNNFSLRGYRSPFLTDLEMPKSKPVSQMTKQELKDEEARLLGNKKP
jgi:hypothetical protein